jgi:hypothetical protein
MSATLILGILELLLQEAAALAKGTSAEKDIAVVMALEDTIAKVKAQYEADVAAPIDLDTLKDDGPIV